MNGLTRMKKLTEAEASVEPALTAAHKQFQAAAKAARRAAFAVSAVPVLTEVL